MNSVSRPRVLLVALANWFGGPRLPRAFSRAGFHVTTFALSGLLILRSQATDETVLLPEATSNEELLAALLAAIERTQPDIVVPTDESSILALHAVAARSRQPGVSDRARGAIAASIGGPKSAATVRNRKALAELASSRGVRTPDHAVVRSEADALAFGARHGYPVVLKEEDSAAGFGVFICKDEGALREALRKSSQHPAVYEQGLLAQTFIAGRTAMRVVVAQAGNVLGGLSALKLETWPTAQGPSTCVELFDHPEMKASCEAIVGALGYSGFASFDFMIDEASRAHLIELNARPTPISHLGERYGACLCRHLHAALTGEPTSAGEPQGLPSRVALFPQEWVRDQNSAHLRAGVYHDAPWEEPDLVEAYVAFGRGQMRYMAYRVLDARDEDLRKKLTELERSAEA
ncbi:MAG: ATP-grasp domain-containing protein [Myxococcales bacterium]|nr:MAG: ATP-grasp domain-containing protein [Myxococcales bacterium]